MKRHRHQEFIRFLNVIDTTAAKKQRTEMLPIFHQVFRTDQVIAWDPLGPEVI